MKNILSLFVFSILMACAGPREKSVLAKYILSTESNYRGIAAVSDEICWFSGSEGSVYRIDKSSDQPIECSPKGYRELDFRDIHAFSKDKAIILSAGLPAVILLTEDGGESWMEVYRNEKEGIFFDAMDFWDAQRGIAFSDAIGQALTIIETNDGGRNWQTIDASLIPPVHPNQGGFAASGTCLKTFGNGQVIIGLGGKEATILKSENYGKSWHRGFAPIDNGESSKGIFSFSFIDEKRILVVGGDFNGDSLSKDCISISENGGYSWKVSNGSRITLYSKYLSNIIAIDANQWFCNSRFGSYFTEDGGRSWQSFPFDFYSGSLGEKNIWLSGAKGNVGRVSLADLKENR
jgi:photosystem II stability/assembly factor-like uncharacterized protein